MKSLNVVDYLSMDHPLCSMYPEFTENKNKQTPKKQLDSIQ